MKAGMPIMASSYGAHSAKFRKDLKALRKDYPPINLAGATIGCVRLDGADLEEANLENANLSKASLVGANLKNTRLKGTILKGADLSDVRNLTEEQIKQAITDEETILPDYLARGMSLSFG
ncbi:MULTISPECIES: pentapeptide repeat-containing protein [unclassified Iodidimonas]|jgi:uncharacterized protein YjbI with pentapeptide repeats|uniref:pentapeptide repeat-containing protein n=1 Tax=unclassified Iodidimonas TaxID=2626145 RepID=UPI002482C8A6|nr:MULTISPECIES: pentapeptide repeat-containing protein [unclassified Iodidimonas]